MHAIGLGFATFAIAAYAVVLGVWAALEIRDLRRSGYPPLALLAEAIVDIGLLAGVVAFAAGIVVPVQPLWAVVTPILGGTAMALRILAFKHEEADLELSPGFNQAAHVVALAVVLLLVGPAVFMLARVVYPGGLWPAPALAIAVGMCVGGVIAWRIPRFAGVSRSRQERRWKQVEAQLHTASVEALTRFASEHDREAFSGFMFDCNADCGDVLLCLDTKTDRDPRERWNAGDWTYQGFNIEAPHADAWEARWSATQEAIAEACLADDGDETREQFLETVCRVLVAIERKGGFGHLVRDDRFATLVCDHDESLDDARARLDRVRTSVGAA